MLAIPGPRTLLCSGPGRREILRLGALGLFGMTWPDLLRARAAAGPAKAPGARRCILLFLTGGPPQLDTWDLKPDAPDRIRGEFKPIETTVPGLRIGELFPRLAQRAHHLCVVRSVTHADLTHTSAGYAMLSGMPHPRANANDAGMVRPGPDDHPHLGALVAKVRPPVGAVPPFVSLPEVIKDAAVNEFPGLDGGFLGGAFAPFLVEADDAKTRLRLPEITLPAGVARGRLLDRAGLRARLDRGLSAAEPLFDQLDEHYRKAFALIQSEPVKRALDLDREPPGVHDRYGRHLFGQGCLMARRLAEAGVAFTTVYWHYEGPDDSPVWDTHWNNFKHLRERLMPPTDQAFSALLDDLAARGLLEETLVVCMGEFGRSPRINNMAGREHWAAAQSIVLAGAGIRAGTVLGATDRDGAYPVNDPASPADVAATLLKLLGVPLDLMIKDRSGRPLRACQGSPIAGVLA